jgi:hypothetical protein
MGIIAAFLLAPPLFLHLPARSQGASPRDLIQSGVDAYIKSGPNAAFSAWFKGTFSKGDKELKLQSDAMNIVLKQFDAEYGALEGFDVILDLNVGTRARFIYFVLYYEKGSAYGYFEALRLKSGGWIMLQAEFSSKPDEIIPATLLPRLPAAQ